MARLKGSKNRLRSTIITDPRREFAEAFMSGMSITDAGKKVGISAKCAQQWSERPEVVAYMLDRRDRAVEEASRETAASIVKFHMTRDEWFAYVAAVANMSPAMTKGSMVTQLRALEIIGKVLGYMEERLEGNGKPKMFRAEWLGATVVQ